MGNDKEIVKINTCHAKVTGCARGKCDRGDAVALATVRVFAQDWLRMRLIRAVTSLTSILPSPFRSQSPSL